MIAFKRFASVDEWKDLHPRLREVLEWLEDRWPGRIMVVTRIYTPPVAGESGVHRDTPHRAADCRTNDLPKEVGKDLEEAVNDKWDYGKITASGRKLFVALQHGAGPNRHLHLQVRDSTRPISKDDEDEETS